MGPIRPGAAPTARGSNGRGVTPSKKGSGQPGYESWDWWWDLNEERFLLLKRKVRIAAVSTDHADIWLDESFAVDEVARVTLRQIQREIGPALGLGLKDAFYDTRAAAAIAVGKISDSADEGAVEWLRGVFSDQDRRVRESACLGLGVLGNPEAIPDLMAVLKNTEKGRRLMGRGTADVFARTRAFAAVALGLIGHRNGLDASVMEELVKLGSTPGRHEDIQLGPVLALQLVKSQAAIPGLRALVNDETQDDYIRAHAVVALGKVGGVQALSDLQKHLFGKSSPVARSCAIALGLLAKPHDKEAVTKLLRAAKGAHDRATRNFAMIALGEIGDPRGLALLEESLRRGPSIERGYAALGLGINGFHRPALRDEHAKLLLDSYKSERSEPGRAPLAIGLGLLGYTNAAVTLKEDLGRAGSPDLRGHLATALGLLGHHDALPEIRNLVGQKGDVDLRRRAAIALGLLRDPEAVSVLQAVIRESSASKAILGAATVALGYVGDRRAVPVLTAMLENDKNAHQDVTRAFAAVALGFLGDKDDIPILSRIQENSNYLSQTDALAELLTIL